MKPNFALAMTNEGAELMHRAKGGWVPVGTVEFDRPDRDKALAALCDEARRLAPEGVSTKLIVPDSEIRYATVLAPGPTDEARRYQIESEIEGLTPYGIDDLAYDWSVEEDHAQVAIVARETLIEVEEFATERGFNPVSFVAIPTGGQFLGEPFFGQTGHARGLLKPGDMVQPDAEPVRRLARPPAAEAPAAKSKPDAKPAPKPQPKPAVDSAPAAATTPAAKRWEPDRPSVAAATGEGMARVGDLVRKMGTRLRREQAEAPQGTDGPPAPARSAPVSAPSGKIPAAAALAAFVPKLRGRGGDDGRATAAAALAPAVEPEGSVRPPEPVEDITAAPAESEPAEGSVIAFSSRRKAPPDAAPAEAGAAQTGPATPGGRLAITRRDGAGPEGGTLGGAARGMVRGTLDRLGLLDLVRKGLRQQPAQKRRKKKKDLTGAGAAPIAGAGAMPEAARSRAPEVVVPESRPPQSPREKISEAESLTLFGRRGQPEPAPMLPYRALVAIGAVLAVLVMVAVWALYLNRSDAPVAEIADAPAAVQPPAPPATAGIVPPESLAPVETAPETAADPVPDSTPVAPAESETAAVAAPVEDQPEPGEIAAATDSQPDASAPGIAAETGSDTAAVAPGDAVTDPEALLDSLVQDALTEAQPGDILDSMATSEPEAAPAAGTEAAGTAEAEAEAGTGLPATAGDTAPEGTTTTPGGNMLLALPGRLEAPPAAEVAPVALPAPPPFDQVVAGQSVGGAPEAAPEPEAVTEPEVEVSVTAGRPSSVPAPRRAAIAPPPAPEPEPEAAITPEPAPAVEAEPETATEPAAEPAPTAAAEPEAEAAPVLADDTPRADPALAGARPEPRSPRVAALGAALRAAQPEIAPAEATTDETEQEPANRLDQGALSPDLTPLIRPAALVTETAAEAPPPGGLDLALLRPLRRPTDLVPDPAAEPEADAATEAEAEDDIADEAVARSLLPSARPRGLAARVEAALAAERTRQAPAATATATAAAAPAPAATASAAPSIPSSASVQREATERRAIRTRDANLIGVFGTPSSRRALVRMPNGRVVRLQVGDSFDGGRVSAIGDAELRYVRGGRDQVLRIAGRS